MSDSKIDYKIVLLGGSDSGKTILFKKLLLEDNRFSEKNISTIGNDKRILKFNNIDMNKDGKVEKKNFYISIYDTAGQERYRSITKTYLHGANGIILIYDVTNKTSFNSLETWIESIKLILGDNLENNTVLLLLGNKSLLNDDNRNKEVYEDEAKEFCTKNCMIWGGEINFKLIKLNELKLLFENYVKQIYDKIGEKKIDTIKIIKGKKYEKKKKNNC